MINNINTAAFLLLTPNSIWSRLLMAWEAPFSSSAWNLRFSWRWLWRLSSGMWHSVVWTNYINVLLSRREAKHGKMLHGYKRKKCPRQCPTEVRQTVMMRRPCMGHLSQRTRQHRSHSRRQYLHNSSMFCSALVSYHTAKIQRMNTACGQQMLPTLKVWTVLYYWWH